MHLQDVLCVYVMTVNFVFCGTTVRADMSDSPVCSWASSLHWFALSSFDMRIFVLSYCILFCSAWMSPLGSLQFSGKQTDGEWILGRGEVVVGNSKVE